MNTYEEIVKKIIERQESIIGPVALEQAETVDGLKIDWSKKEVSIGGNEKTVINRLVEKYKELFGRASVEVCKEAAFTLLSGLSADKQPDSLK